jgi:hypothetical protein
LRRRALGGLEAPAKGGDLMVARFCGRCGAPIAPGALYCGNCGAPLATAPPTAAAVAYPAYPQYVYPYAPARPPDARLGPLLLGGAMAGVLVLAVLALSVFAVVARGSSFKPCTARCGPRTVTPFPEQNSFTSKAFRFRVGYPAGWSIQDHDDSSVAFSTRLSGAFLVQGEKPGKSDDALIQQAISSLPSSRWQNVQPLGPIHGAHIGQQDGSGQLFSASLEPAGGQAQKVRIAVIAATHSGVSVTIMGIDPADDQHSPNGIPEAELFDYVLAEFTWG